MLSHEEEESRWWMALTLEGAAPFPMKKDKTATTIFTCPYQESGWRLHNKNSASVYTKTNPIKNITSVHFFSLPSLSFTYLLASY
jgi:hypothetical protein